MRNWETTLERIRAGELYPNHPVVDNGLGEPICKVDGRPFLSFASNNYLSLSHHPEVRKAAVAAIEAEGIGPGSSRVLVGTSSLLSKLEQNLADWTGFEDCLTFPTGYMANVAVIRALLDPLYPDQEVGKSVVFTDQNNHGSIIDGARSSAAIEVRYRHDDLADLERKLNRYAELPNKLIVTQGVFCLEGKKIQLRHYLRLAQKHGAMLMVDDAHGIGLTGSNGGGIAMEEGVNKAIDVYMGCMDKAMGGTGGFLCGKKNLISYLKVACRTSILSSPLPSIMAGAMVEVISQIQANPQWRQELSRKTSLLKQLLRSKGFCILGEHDHPAIPLYIGDDIKGMEISQSLWDKGILLPLMRWPAVPFNKSRFRINLMRNHTDEHMDKLAEALVNCK